MLRPYKNKCTRIKKAAGLNYRAAQKIDLAEMGRSMLRPYKNKCARIRRRPLLNYRAANKKLILPRWGAACCAPTKTNAPGSEGGRYNCKHTRVLTARQLRGVWINAQNLLRL